MIMNDALKKIEPYLVERPRPLIGAETIQLILVREILDYTALRTEETRELNTVHTPRSISKLDESVRRVAFLATKQKAAESRELEHILRTATSKANLAYPECYLKDNLCMQCPRCGLFGGTSTVAGQRERANIKHRIEYSTAFSLLPFEDVGTSVTFNAINDCNQTTGQALGQRFTVQPATIFPAVVTLKSVTLQELIITVKVLLSCKSYGAESRVGGDIRNSIWVIVAGWEEVITSLELTLEMADMLDILNPDEVGKVVTKKYKPLSGNPNQIVVLDTAETEAIVKACAEVNLDKAFLKKVYQDISDYRNEQMT